MSVIANTTVISNFASIGQLDLLRQIFGTLYISTQVYEEIQAGLEEGYRFYEGKEQANDWLQQMIRQGFHFPVSDLTSLLKER